MRDIALLIGAAVAYYYWQKNKGPVTSSARSAASTASRLVSDTVNQTTFIPDITTDAQRYAKDQNACR
jgi:hypothetical protein